MKTMKYIYTITAFLFATLQTFAQTYEYDANNRLTKVKYPNSATVSYTYDDLGNRLSKTVTGGSEGSQVNIAINEETFPDEYFRLYVTRYIDKNGDGVLSTDEASAVKKIFENSYYTYTSDLTGIEYFTELESLNLYRTRVKTLDLSKNTALKSLICNQDSYLESLDISKNVALEILNVNNTKLTSLNVSHLKNLKELHCSGLKLGTFDISNNMSLEVLECGSNELTSLDVSNHLSLKKLRCDYNNLGSLDVSKLTGLTELNCSNDQLTSLDLSNNLALDSLSCSGNNFGVLDVSMLTELKYLVCVMSGLTELDLSKNTKLDYLYCDYNPLTKLDVSKNLELRTLRCNGGKMSETEIYHLPALDISSNTKLETLYCSGNSFTTLDMSKNTALRYLLCNDNQLTALDVTKNANLQQLVCNKNQLTSLDVSKNTALLVVNCCENQLTNIDISKNIDLLELDCSNNQIEQLDVSTNENLGIVYCEKNQLKSLKVSNRNTSLGWLHCPGNELKGAAIDSLISNLPQQTSASITVIDTLYANEKNVCTIAQVAAFKEKGWTVRVRSKQGANVYGDEYKGSIPEGYVDDSKIITFADAKVKALCVANWDINNDGELSEAEAATVTALGEVFKDNSEITSFNELQYFTGLREIGDYSFYNCSALQEIAFPVNIMRIGSGAFFSDEALKEINLPEGLKTIEHAAFGICSSLTSLHIPKTVTYISNNGMAFRDCTGLTVITVDEENPVYDSHNQCNAIIHKETLTLVNGCKTTIVPDDIVSIGRGAFYGQYAITTLKLPASVKTICEGAYDGCGFETLEIPNTVDSIEFSAFWNCHSLTTVILPENTPKMSEEVFLSKTLKSVISYNKNPSAISDGVFDIDWNGTMTTATLTVPAGCKTKYESTDGWKRFTNIEEIDLIPIGNNENINIGDEINSGTNLDGNVVGNILYNISSGNGEFNPEEGCIVVSKPVSDETMNNLEGKDIFGEDFKDQYTGIVLKVAEGKGQVKVEAQTTGNMVLKVKIGNNEPIEMELNGKLTMKVPYNVSEETLVYIYGSTKAAQAKRKGMGVTNTESGTLKIFGIEVTREGTGIQDAVLENETQDVYSLSGQKVRSQAKDLKGLPAGVYIVGGKKIFVK